MRKLSEQKEKILLRRGLVTELYSKGLTERQMAEKLNTSRVTINQDIRILRNQALTNIQTFDTRIPHEYESMLTGIKQVLQRAWSILDNEGSNERMIAIAMHTILTALQQKQALINDLSNIQEALEYRHQSSSQSLVSLRSSLEDKQHVEAIQSQRQRDEAIF